MSLAPHSRVASARAPAFDNCDRSLEIRRLRRNLTTLVNAHPHLEALGDDALVGGLADALGLAGQEHAVLRIRVHGKRSHTLVAVLSRLWHDPAGKDALIALKRAADAAGRGCILVPEASVQRQPRLSTAKTIEQSMGVRVTAEDRLAVLGHLIDVGYSTLFDCACLVKGEAPFAIILSLVAEGAIRMSGEKLRPDTRVDLPSVGFWAA